MRNKEPAAEKKTTDFRKHLMSETVILAAKDIISNNNPYRLNLFGF